MPRITDIFIKEGKEVPRREIEKGFFKAAFGLEGDIYSGGDNPDRQLCALRTEDREAVTKDQRDGLCFERFTETIRIEGLSLEDLPPGQRLRMGGMTAEIRKRGKRCWPECRIIQAGDSPCALRKGALFMAILESGEVKKGDEVVLL